MNSIQGMFLKLVGASNGGATYYVDSSDGNDGNTGMSEGDAWRSISKINSLSFSPGDTILFKRGRMWREQLLPDSGNAAGYITYGAYGTGPKPLILGSKNCSSQSNWVYEGSNIWRTIGISLPLDVGNLIFEEGQPTGRKVLDQVDLISQGRYWYDSSGDCIKMYSTSNPGTYYPSIECAFRQMIIYEANRNYIIYENLDLRYGGSNAIGGVNPHHIIVRNCTVGYIGGSIQSGTTRYGNGIEFYRNAHDCLAENNYIYEVYDAALTNQQSTSMASDEYNIYFYNNVVRNSEYCYEFFNGHPDSSTYNIIVENNTCIGMGRGWGHDQRPDPRGRDLRVSGSGGTVDEFHLRNNIFYNAVDQSIYIPASFGSGYNFYLDHNLYYKPSGTMIYWRGAHYSASELSDYQSEKNQDANSLVGNPDFVDEDNFDFHPNLGSSACTLSASGSYVGALPCGAEEPPPPPPPNNPPTHSPPLLNSADASNSTYTDLVCANQSTADEDGDSVVNSYTWYRNGALFKSTMPHQENIVLYMPLDENKNEQLDYSGKRHNGTVTNAAFTSGNLGGGYYFDGSATIDTGSYSIADANHASTISFWINQTFQDSSYKYIIASRTLEAGAYTVSIINGDFVVMAGTTTINIDANIQPDRWHHAAFSFTGTSMTPYIDGESLGPTDYSIANWDAAKKIVLGNRDGGSPHNHFQGVLDEVRIWNTSLSESEIKALYDIEKSGTHGLLDSSITSASDQFICEVQPMDQHDKGTVLNSTSIEIISIPNEPPHLSLQSPSDDALLGQTTVEFNWVAADDHDAVVLCNLTVDGIVESDILSANGSETGRNISGLSDGAYSWHVSCWDSSDNLNTSQSRTLNIDTEVPVVVLDGPSDNAWQQSGFVTFLYTATNNQISNCTLYRNISGAWQADEIDTDVASGIQDSFAKQLSNGSYEWNVFCCDVTGNCAYSAADNMIYIDSIAPAVELDAPADNHEIYESSVDFRWKAIDNLAEDLVCDLSIDSQVNMSSIPAANGIYANRTVGGLADGAHSWNVMCADHAGNDNISLTRTFSIDTAVHQILPYLYSASDSDLDGNIELAWEADPTAAYYNIYWHSSVFSDANNASLLTSNITALSYEDIVALHNSTYYYAVTSVNIEGSENKSAINTTTGLSLGAAANDTINPLIVSNLYLSVSGENALLSWESVVSDTESNSDAFGMAYELWKGTSFNISKEFVNDSGSGFSLVKTISANSTADAVSAPGTYHYVVASKDDAGNMNYSISLEDNYRNVTLSETTTVPPGSSSGGGGGGGGSGTPRNRTSNVESLSFFWTLITAGETVTMMPDSSEIALSHLSVSISKQSDSVGFTINSPQNKPPAIPLPPGIVYQYLDINYENIDKRDITGAKMNFSVLTSWIDENKFAKEDIALYRHVDNSWQKLKTEIHSSDDEYVYYEAASPGLSLLAVTGWKIIEPAVEEPGQIIIPEEEKVPEEEIVPGDQVVEKPEPAEEGLRRIMKWMAYLIAFIALALVAVMGKERVKIKKFMKKLRKRIRKR